MLPLESLNGLVTFVTTARSGSFTEAADALGISRSAVGKAIARLEARLGVRLFHRTTRRIALTTDGEAYYASCGGAGRDLRRRGLPGLGRPAQRAAAHRHAVLVRAAGGAAGAVRLCRQYPDLQLTMTFTDHFVDPVEEGIDLLIRFGGLHQAEHLVRAAGAPAPGHLRIAGVPAGARRAAHRGGTGAAPQHRRLPPRATGGVADRQ
jgi:DNA-binding transcriptional LysR family regulator